MHLTIFYEYQQFFQHHICFSIQPQLQLVNLHRNRRYFVIKLHTWFCLSYFLKTNIKFYFIYQYFMSINSFFNTVSVSRYSLPITVTQISAFHQFFLIICLIRCHIIHTSQFESYLGPVSVQLCKYTSMRMNGFFLYFYTWSWGGILVSKVCLSSVCRHIFFTAKFFNVIRPSVFILGVLVRKGMDVNLHDYPTLHFYSKGTACSKKGQSGSHAQIRTSNNAKSNSEIKGRNSIFLDMTLYKWAAMHCLRRHPMCFYWISS